MSKMNLMTLVPEKEMSIRQDILEAIKDNDQVTVLSEEDIRKDPYAFIPVPFEILYEIEAEDSEKQFKPLYKKETKDKVGAMTQDLNQLTVIKTTDADFVKQIETNGSNDALGMMTVYVESRPHSNEYVITMINDLNDYFWDVLN